MRTLFRPWPEMSSTGDLRTSVRPAISCDGGDGRQGKLSLVLRSELVMLGSWKVAVPSQSSH